MQEGCEPRIDGAQQLKRTRCLRVAVSDHDVCNANACIYLQLDRPAPAPVSSDDSMKRAYQLKFGIERTHMVATLSFKPA